MTISLCKALVDKALEGTIILMKLPLELLGQVRPDVALVNGDHYRPIGDKLCEQPAGPLPLLIKLRVLVVYQSPLHALVPEMEVMLEDVGYGP